MLDGLAIGDRKQPATDGFPIVERVKRRRFSHHTAPGRDEGILRDVTRQLPVAYQPAREVDERWLRLCEYAIELGHRQVGVGKWLTHTSVISLPIINRLSSHDPLVALTDAIA